MEFFATTEVVAQIEADLHAASEPAPPELLMQLAWQLRQRDTDRSLVLTQALEGLIRHTPEPQRALMEARSLLIRAEAKWLFGELAASKALASSAVSIFRANDDHIGCADAHWILAWIVFDQGDLPQAHSELDLMIKAAAADPVRILIGSAALARFCLFQDFHAAIQTWEQQFASLGPDLHPAALCWIEDFFALASFLGSDYINAIKHFNNTWEMSLISGQQRRAIFAALNIGDVFKTLSEYNTALEWTQRSLERARQCGWQNAIGIALTHVAEVLHRLERFDTAHEMVCEAISIMASKKASRDYAVALQIVGDIELRRAQYRSALESFVHLEQRANALDQPDLKCAALRGQAHACLQLDEPQAALEAAHRALAVERAHVDFQIAAFQVMAEIHARHSLPAPPGISSKSIPLHFLHQALNLANTVNDFVAPTDLLDAMADEYAKVGDYTQAFNFARQASLVREKTKNREAADRANAMQLNYQTQQVRAEAEHHRQLALAEAQRAEILQHNGETLANLSKIGQEITAHLDTETVARVLVRHVHRLLDATTFMIFRIDEKDSTLNLTFGVEHEQRMSAWTIALSDPNSNAARCAREAHEILIDFDVAENPGAVLPGTVTTRCAVFSPLCVGEKAIGVMSIQSLQPQAYGERELLIVRSLCAYTAIALANAETLSALRHAQRQLIKQEKMAALGGLVAGFAHQLNTPIAAIKSSGQHIVESLTRTLKDTLQLLASFDHETWPLFVLLINQRGIHPDTLSSREERQQVRELTTFLTSFPDAQQKAAILIQLRARPIIDNIMPLLRHPDCDSILATACSLSMIFSNAENINIASDRMAKIIAALKTFSGVEQTQVSTEAHLHHGIELALAPLRAQMQNKVELQLDFQPIRALRCLPDQLNQVWSNLIQNALQAMNYQGRLGIRIDQQPDYAVVSIQDNGCGIDQSIRDQIFEPFFTTKGTGEGGGLGLAIAKIIIERHHGTIDLAPAPDGGTIVIVRLPWDATTPPCTLA